MNYKIGDNVMLKSGGPKMSVYDYWNNAVKREIKTVWFDENNHRQEGWFPEDCLILIIKD